MAPKKKPPANAFFFYMMERKGQYERNGERFPNGMKDVAVVCGPEWENMPPQARKKYEDMAKAEKARQKGDTARKYTNQHKSFDHIDRSKAEEEEAKNKMNKDIVSIVRTLINSKKMAEFKFYVIHANYFCITEGDCYHPAELAVAEFSLLNGVTDVYHTIINTGPIPLGYRHDAMLKSDTVHHIPLEPEDGEKQIYEIWKKIKAIIGRGRSAHGGAYPPLYTMPDNVNLNTSISCVKSVIKTLCEGCDDDPEDFRVYSLDKLFYEMRNACADYSLQKNGSVSEGQTDFFTSKDVACRHLEYDVYNFTPGIACSFHFNADQVENCSKSFVQRWVFLICDWCCQYLDIELIPGQHVPKGSDVNYKRQHKQFEKEENSAGSSKSVDKPFTFLDASGKQIRSFMPVQVEHKPLPQPTVKPTYPAPTQAYNTIDTSEENFPAIPIGGRGRGRVAPRGGGGRGSGPMSFAAAMQSRK